MYKALYGSRSGGACWHGKTFDILQQMDFKPSKADPDIWMRSSKDGTHFEYIAVYVDALAICMNDPQAFAIHSRSIQAQLHRCWTTKLPSCLWIHKRSRWNTC